MPNNRQYTLKFCGVKMQDALSFEDCEQMKTWLAMFLHNYNGGNKRRYVNNFISSIHQHNSDGINGNTTVTPDEALNMNRLRQQGKSYEQVAREVGYCATTVYKYAK